MQVPKGKPVHEHLKTSYLNTAALLADLQVTGFTGYLQAIFPYVRGYVFINTGVIMNALDEGPERVRQGSEAIDAILLRAAAPDGQISVYSHPSIIVEAIAGRIDGEVVYQGLESEFTDLAKLVTKLRLHSDARYYIEVELPEEGEGIIYLVDGNVNAMVSLSNGEIVENESGYQRILALVTEYNAIYHVYRCASSSLLAPALAGALNNVISFPEPALPPFPNDLAEVASEATLPPLVSEPASDELAELDEAEYQAQYQRLVALMSEIIQVVERAATRLTKEESFAVALRAGLLAVAERYPFFDPFAAEFEYLDGKIKFSVTPPPADFVIGLTQALKHTLRELARMVPTVELRTIVADALIRLQQMRQAEYEHFSLAPALAELVAVD
ncbi:MAG: hypothetical protein AB1489_19755 [Acidobacteriota bacterium]